MRIVLSLGLLLLSACTYSTKMLVKSSGPASIEIDGFQACEAAPCEVELKCSDPNRWSSYQTLTAIPKTRGQYTQTKQINACAIPRGISTISFEMELHPATPKADITIRNKK